MNRADKCLRLAIVIVTFSFGSFILSETHGQEIKNNRLEAEELNRQAVSRTGEKRFDEAIELLNNAIKLAPEFVEAHLNLGTVHQYAGRPEIAVGHIKRGLQLDPRSHIGHNQLGVVYDELGKLDMSIESFKTATELKPDFALAHFNLGAAYAWTGRLKPAEAALQKATRLDPSNVEIRLYLAAVYAKQARPSEAIAKVKEITRESPDHETANLMLCRFYLLADDRRSALSVYQSFKSVNAPLAEQMFKSIFKDKVVILPKERN